MQDTECLYHITTFSLISKMKTKCCTHCNYFQSGTVFHVVLHTQIMITFGMFEVSFVGGVSHTGFRVNECT